VKRRESQRAIEIVLSFHNLSICRNGSTGRFLIGRGIGGAKKNPSQKPHEKKGHVDMTRRGLYMYPRRRSTSEDRDSLGNYQKREKGSLLGKDAVENKERRGERQAGP